MPFGDHAGHIVVDAAAQHRAEDDPEEHHRPEAGPHQRAEDGPGAGDIEKLHQERLPGGHRHEIDAVVSCIGRGLPSVGRKYALYDPAVDEVTDDQDRKG